MMRRAERTLRKEPFVLPHLTRGGMDQRCFQRFLIRHRRQDARQTPRQHRFSASGDSHHQQVMSPGRRDFQRLSGGGLPFDIFHVVCRAKAGGLRLVGRRRVRGERGAARQMPVDL